MPVKPVVSYVSAPNYLLAKFLDRWFKSVVDFMPPYSSKNLMTLVDNIKLVNPPPNFSLVSFDFVGLYPHIPKAPILRTMGELLTTAGCYHEVITEFFDLIRLC